MMTINNGFKKVSVFHNEKHYAIGFKNQILARHVQYNLFHTLDTAKDPIIYLCKKDTDSTINIDFKSKQATMSFCNNADLYIQKAKPISDRIVYSPYHLDVVPEKTFLCYPIDQNIGIVIPEEIVEEDDDIMVLQCQMIDSFFIPDYYRKQLSRQYDKN